MREIIETVLAAFQDQVLQLMFRPGSGPPFADLPKGPDSPFHAIVVEVENVVRDGIERGEFRDVGDVHPVVELLSGPCAPARNVSAGTRAATPPRSTPPGNSSSPRSDRRHHRHPQDDAANASITPLNCRTSVRG